MLIKNLVRTGRMEVHTFSILPKYTHYYFFQKKKKRADLRAKYVDSTIAFLVGKWTEKVVCDVLTRTNEWYKKEISHDVVSVSRFIAQEKKIGIEYYHGTNKVE